MLTYLNSNAMRQRKDYQNILPEVPVYDSSSLLCTRYSTYSTKKKKFFLETYSQAQGITFQRENESSFPLITFHSLLPKSISLFVLKRRGKRVRSQKKGSIDMGNKRRTLFMSSICQPLHFLVSTIAQPSISSSPSQLPLPKPPPPPPVENLKNLRMLGQ